MLTLRNKIFESGEVPVSCEYGREDSTAHAKIVRIPLI
jgi:hypothetical protein